MHFNKSVAIVAIIVLMLSITLPVGAVTYNYDSNNRMVSVDYGIGQVYFYSYDAIGNLRGITAGVHVLSTTPTNEAVGVSVYDDISVVFNSNIALGSHSDSHSMTVSESVYSTTGEANKSSKSVLDAIRVLDENDSEVPCSINIENNVLTIKPSTFMNNGTNYHVIIAAGSVISSRHTEVSLASDYDFRFATASTRSEGAVKEVIENDSGSDKNLLEDTTIDYQEYSPSDSPEAPINSGIIGILPDNGSADVPRDSSVVSSFD